MCHEVRKLENSMSTRAHALQCLLSLEPHGSLMKWVFLLCLLGKLSNLPIITQLENEDLKPSLSESRAWHFVASLVFAPTLALWLISSFSFLSVSLPESVSLLFPLSPAFYHICLCRHGFLHILQGAMV